VGVRFVAEPFTMSLAFDFVRDSASVGAEADFSSTHIMSRPGLMDENNLTLNLALTILYSSYRDPKRVAKFETDAVDTVKTGFIKPVVIALENNNGVHSTFID
jgi:hypothetical protein